MRWGFTIILCLWFSVSSFAQVDWGDDEEYEVEESSDIVRKDTPFGTYKLEGDEPDEKLDEKTKQHMAAMKARRLAKQRQMQNKAKDDGR